MSSSKLLLKENPTLKDVSDTDPAGIKEVRIKLKNDAKVMEVHHRKEKESKK